MDQLPEYVDGLPNLSGAESLVEQAIAAGRAAPVFAGRTGLDVRAADATFAVGLHMHQPLVPAGGPDLRTADIIGNLQWMDEHPEVKDNHNAPAMRECYRRMGEIIPNLLADGLAPRIMLEYSGTLLHGLRRMGAHDVIDALRRITTEPQLRDTVEWLGCTWGHAVAPATPVRDYRLHVRAWQQHFAAVFGWEALSRVRGFFPAELALPNHPDAGYEFVRTLTSCGYQWVAVQEHTVEAPDGAPVARPHLPHRLVCASSAGPSAEIVAVVKTQGSDTKLVAQMQPYHEARTLGPQRLAGRDVPPLVTQLADGENGGVMMNEFPTAYVEAVRQCSGSRTPMVNVTEYLEQLFAAGVRVADLPVVQPVRQHRVWQRMAPGDGPRRLSAVLGELAAEDPGFRLDGDSWTSEVSWTDGYDQVLGPMWKASAQFHERLLDAGVPTTDDRYRRALFLLLTAETSCYRYWGQGLWTDYGQELARRTTEAITAGGRHAG